METAEQRADAHEPVAREQDKRRWKGMHTQNGTAVLWWSTCWRG